LPALPGLQLEPERHKRYLPVEPSKQPSFPSIEAADNHSDEEQELRHGATRAVLSFC